MKENRKFSCVPVKKKDQKYNDTEVFVAANGKQSKTYVSQSNAVMIINKSGRKRDRSHSPRIEGSSFRLMRQGLEG